MTDLSQATALRRAQWMDTVNALFGRFAVSPQTASEPGSRFALSNCSATLFAGAADQQFVAEPIQLLDISRTGVGYSIHRPLAPGERARLEFDALEGAGVSWALEVVWCRRSATGEYHVGAVVSASRSVSNE